MKSRARKDELARAMRVKYTGLPDEPERHQARYRVPEAAKLLGVSETKLHRMIRGDPMLRYMPPGGRGERLIPIITEAFLQELYRRMRPEAVNPGGAMGL